MIMTVMTVKSLTDLMVWAKISIIKKLILMFSALSTLSMQKRTTMSILKSTDSLSIIVKTMLQRIMIEALWTAFSYSISLKNNLQVWKEEKQGVSLKKCLNQEWLTYVSSTVSVCSYINSCSSFRDDFMSLLINAYTLATSFIKRLRSSLL